MFWDIHSSSSAALPLQLPAELKPNSVPAALADLLDGVTLPNHSSHLTLALLDCWSPIKEQRVCHPLWQNPISHQWRGYRLAVVQKAL